MFVQIVEFETDRIDEGHKHVDAYRDAVKGKTTARRAVLCRDRARPDHYLNVVFFDDYESAMENSQLPETQELAKNLGELAKGSQTFYDLDVVRDDEM